MRRRRTKIRGDVGKSKKRLTIAHVMPWSGMGGVEVATLRMIDATRHQFRCVLFCLQDAVSLRNTAEAMAIETMTYNAPEPSLRHAVRYYRDSAAVARQFLQAGVDIVHFADDKAAYHNSLASLLSRSRTVCHVRSSNPSLDRRKRLSLLPVQSFIFVSNEAKQTFPVRLAEDRARVIYDAVEIPEEDLTAGNDVVRRQLGVPEGSKIVGMVARVAPVKDYHTLANAAARIVSRYPNTRFVIVGDNSLVDINKNHYQTIVAKLQELGILHNFIFTGHRDDVPQLIAAMDICVLCSHREGFPLSILESMAMRKPVVATAVGGIPEIIEHGVTGYLHQHGNSDELSDAVTSLIEDPQTAARLGMEGFERVRKNYSRQRFSEQIANAYWDTMRL